MVSSSTIRISVIGAALFAATLLVSPSSFAQSTTSGDLTGLVSDASGAAVPGATVTALNQGTAVQNVLTTSGTGEYHFTNLPVGKYTLAATAAGFATAQIKNIDISLNTVVTENVKLDIGTTTSSVEVSEAAVVIDTTTAQVAGSFDSRQMAELPSASTGSGVLNLSLLQSGVGTSGTVGIGMGPSVGGQRPANNSFTIEGIDNNNRTVTGAVVSVPNDADAEFTLLQNQFSPDFGHSSGGQFNQVIKSGTNSYHGELYEYSTNRDLLAADNLNFVDGNPLHPRFDNNRFGGNFGGPILRNKLFFFVDYEYNPIGGEASGGAVFAPTSAGYAALASIPGISATNLSILQKYLGTAATAVPVSTLGGSYPLVGQSSFGNESGWTQTQINAATPIPLGNIPTAAPSYTNNESAVASIDYTISDRDSLRGRFILNRSGSIDTLGFPSLFYTNAPSNAYLATMTEFHNFSPNVINEFRFGYNRSNSFVGVPKIPFPGLDVFPNIGINELGVLVGPDPNAPSGGVQNIYELTNNVSYTHGAHTFKFGFDGTDSISPQFFTQRGRGDYEWNYLSDYLFDFYPDYIAQRNVGGREYYGNNYLFGIYGNDTWKVRPNLTVNLGLRWEYQTVPLGEREQDLNVAANVPGLISFNAPTPQATNFMPRVGIAYSPGNSGKTSIRAGFGINYDVNRDNLGLDAAVPQFSSTIDVTGFPGQGFLANGGISPTSVAASPTVAELRAETGGVLPTTFTRPESIQWNFGIQHVFAENYTVEVRYLGTRGVHLDVQDQLNRQPIVNASNALPVYFSAPSQATLDGLTSTLSSLTGQLGTGNIVPAYLAAGFTGILTSFQPWGNSSYNGLATQMNRRFSNGLQFISSYTWSHNIDDSTADVFSTYTTPRRPQNARDLSADRSSSALDHRQRLTFAGVYDLPFFKNGQNWFLRNLVGNWLLAPIYTYQTGTLATAQAGTDSNLNGDSAGDRTIVNPAGNPNVGSDVSPLTNSAGQIVAYQAINPSAGYVATPKGALATGGRNTLMLEPIDDIDLSLTKRFTFREHYSLELGIRATNIFNHPQYTGGFLNDVGAVGATSTNIHNTLIPSSPTFTDWSQAFSSNPRSAQIVGKFIF